MIVALFVIGAALELVGIALVGWDVLDARRTVNDMSKSDWLRGQEENRSLFELMAIVAAGNIGRRVLGVGFFTSGLVAQTIANITAL